MQNSPDPKSSPRLFIDLLMDDVALLLNKLVWPYPNLDIKFLKETHRELMVEITTKIDRFNRRINYIADDGKW